MIGPNLKVEYKKKFPAETVGDREATTITWLQKGVKRDAAGVKMWEGGAGEDPVPLPPSKPKRGDADRPCPPSSTRRATGRPRSIGDGATVLRGVRFGGREHVCGGGGEHGVFGGRERMVIGRGPW